MPGRNGVSLGALTDYFHQQQKLCGYCIRSLSCHFPSSIPDQWLASLSSFVPQLIAACGNLPTERCPRHRWQGHLL
jgi:hypothetical protein